MMNTLIVREKVLVMTWDELPITKSIKINNPYLNKDELNLKLSKLRITKKNLHNINNPKVNKLIHTDNQFNNTALLLSDKNPFFSKACYFSDNQNMVVRIPDFKGSITKQITDAIDYVNKKYNNYWWIITGAPQRTERYDYPKRAIKNAVLASFIYRDYRYPQTFNSFYAYKNKLVINIPMNHTIGKNINPILTSVLTLLGYLKPSTDLIKNIINSYKDTEWKPKIDKKFNRITLPNLNYGKV